MPRKMAPTLKWQDEKSKMALQSICLAMSWPMIPNMPMLQAIQQLQWIVLAKKEDASKDGMEASMTKKFSLNNWPWLELPFDIYQP